MIGDYVPANAIKILYPDGLPVVEEIEGYPPDQLARADFVGFELVDAGCFRLVFQLRPPADDRFETTGLLRDGGELAVNDGGRLRPLKPGDVVEGVQVPGKVKGRVERIRINGIGALIVEIDTPDGIKLIEVPRWHQHIHGDWSWRVVDA